MWEAEFRTQLLVAKARQSVIFFKLDQDIIDFCMDNTTDSAYRTCKHKKLHFLQE